MNQTETTTQKAAKVRAEIKAAMKDGTLGTLPGGLKISVRTQYASCMSAIDIILRGDDLDGWALTEPVMDHGFPTRHLTEECTELSASLLEIGRKHYNADGRHSFMSVSLDSGLLVGCA